MQSLRKRLKNWFLFRLITAIISLLNFLPRNYAIDLAGLLGKLSYFLITPARRKTKENLKLAFGREISENRLKEIACQAFVNLGKNVADAVRLKKTRWKDVEKITEIEGLEYFDTAYRAGKGVIGFTGHIGNFELMAAYFSLRGYKLSVIGREVYDPRLDRLLVKNRESVGLKNIPSSAGAKPLLKVLRKGEFLGILADQDSSRVRGVFINFFGRPARTPVGPVLLAYKTGSPIVPMAIVRKEKNRYKIIVRSPVKLACSDNREKDITDTLQKCTDALESIIRHYPDQWLWMHDRWKSKPEQQ
ncbi:MAG: lysophospholipid acyltransferase family protein [Candidatus Zixiibacteriota bacterium]